MKGNRLASCSRLRIENVKCSCQDNRVDAASVFFSAHPLTKEDEENLYEETDFYIRSMDLISSIISALN